MHEQENQHLDDLIRSSFEKKSKGAPDSLWGKLSSAMDGDAAKPFEKELPLDPLDAKVKESFSSLNERAPRQVWPAINRRLNIDKVWHGISSELDKARPQYWTGRRMAAAAAILLLFLSGVGTYGLFTGNKHVQATAHAAKDQSLEINEAAAAKETIVTEDAAQEASAKQAASTKEILAGEEDQLSKTTGLGIKNKPQALPTAKADRTGAADSREPHQIEQTTPAFADIAIAEKRQDPGMIRSMDVASELVSQPEANPGAAFSLADESAANNKHQKRASLVEQPSREGTNKSSAVEKATNEAISLPVALNASDSKNLKQSKSFDSAMLLAGKATTNNAQENAKLIPHDVKGIAFIPEPNKGTVEVAVLPLSDVQHQQSLTAALEEQAKKQSIKRRFEAGPVMVYNNSWLLNNETKRSYDKNSLIATDPTYKNNWGLVFNYRLGRKNLLATELHLIGRVGQQYKMYQQGEYLRKELELRYYKFYLQYQQNFLEWGRSIPSCLTAKAGVYGGYLDSKQGELRSQEHSQYARYDYGLRLALGQETRLGSLTVGYGFSAERGLNNVFRGTEKLPAEFNKTYILNFGIYLNLRYYF